MSLEEIPATHKEQVYPLVTLATFATLCQGCPGWAEASLVIPGDARASFIPASAPGQNVSPASHCNAWT